VTPQTARLKLLANTARPDRVSTATPALPALYRGAETPRLADEPGAVRSGTGSRSVAVNQAPEPWERQHLAQYCACTGITCADWRSGHRAHGGAHPALPLLSVALGLLGFAPSVPKPGIGSPSTRDERAGKGSSTTATARMAHARGAELLRPRPRAPDLSGQWEPEYALGLAPCAMARRAYLRDVRAIRALKEVEPALLKDWGRPGRDQAPRPGILADFLMIPHERVPLAVMNEEGLDTDIAELCEPPDF